MGLFGKKKKKKPELDFDDDEPNDGPQERDEDGPIGGGPGGMGGSDDNPYADDPAHKHLVKLLDTNGLVRHRRAFIRNSVYTVDHAKKLDAAKMEKIGVFLEADRKKLIRIFKDAEVVESVVDAERAKEQERADEENVKKAKDKKGKKDSTGKKKKEKRKEKKGKRKKKIDSIEDGEIDDEEEEEEAKGKKKSKKKDKRAKKNKADRKVEEFTDDEVEKDSSRKKSKKSKKEKKSKKKSSDDFEDDEDEESFVGKEKKKTKRDKKGKEKKTKKKTRSGSGDEADTEEGFDDEQVKGTEKKKSKKGKKEKKSKKPKYQADDFVEKNPLSDLDQELEEAEEVAKRNEKPPKLEASEIGEKNTDMQDDERKQSTGEPQIESGGFGEPSKLRRMSHGDRAAKLLNKKLGKPIETKRASRSSRRSAGTVDEDEELWWRSLDKPLEEIERAATSDVETDVSSVPERNRPSKKSKAKSKLKVKPEYGTKLEYITDDENEVLQDFRKRNKGVISRRKRPVLSAPAPFDPLLNQTHSFGYDANAPPPAPPYRTPVPTTGTVQQPSTPPSSNEGLKPAPVTYPGSQMPHHTMSYMHPWYYHPPAPPPEIYYNEPAQTLESDDASKQSANEFSKYKYYKDKYNERKKLKAHKKHKLRQRLKKDSQERGKQERKREFKTQSASDKLYVDLKKKKSLPTEKEQRKRRPKPSSSKFVNDPELQASEHENNVHRLGTDNHYFNYEHEKRIPVRKGKRQGTDSQSEQKVKYFHSPKNLSGYDSDTELYTLRRKLAEVGASRYYPLLVKNGIMSLKDCEVGRLEKLPMASRSQKKSLIRILADLRKGSRNLKARSFHPLAESDDTEPLLERNVEDKRLKSVLKTKSKSSSGNSRSKSPKNRHYFASEHVMESEHEPDNVKSGPIAVEAAKVEEDKKSVKFDLNDEDEISLPSYFEDRNSDSDLSLYSDLSS